jgi:stage V sporulation protein B
VLGNESDYGSAYGAAGGTLGTNLGALAGLLFVGFLFFAYKPLFKRQMRRDKNTHSESYREIFKILLFTIVPVLLSTTVYNISSIIDQAIFKNVANLQGYSSDNISEWWGIFGVQYKTIINIPLAIASALAASCVPNLSAAYSCRDRDGVRRQINIAIRFIMVISIPCAVGLGVLASPVMLLLFHEPSPVASGLLQAGAISVIFYSMSTLSNGLLQGINRMREPVKNALIALVLHIVCLFFLMFGLHLNIYAVVYANTFFAFVMCFLNALSVKRFSGYRQEVVKTFLVPLASSAVMGVIVYVVYYVIHMLTHNNPTATIVSIIIGAISYFVCLLLMKGLSEEELIRLPKGRTILSIAKKIKLMK